jgi:hypothetical protein
VRLLSSSVKGLPADVHAAVGTFAKQKKIAYVSYWMFNRDFAGSNDDTDSVAKDQTKPYQFFTTFKSALGQ